MTLTRFLHSQDQDHFRARRHSNLIGSTLLVTHHERFKSGANPMLFDAQGE
jgi:hypothetical protein